jgi:20S proteasome subunit beta 2
MTTKMVSSQLELHRLNTNRVVPVACASTLLKQYLFRYQGYVSAALVLGGVDNDGPHIYSIHPHGSTDRLPYATMGSGSLAAMSVFESRWKPEMSEEEAKKLVRDAIAAGIFNDLGSGSNVDLCVIRKNSKEYLRNYEIANERGQRKLNYDYKRGTSGVQSVKQFKFDVIEEQVIAGSSGVETMDTN